jgi:hypothetical protein
MDIVARYGHTPEATEANKMLTGLKVGEDNGNARANETWREGIQTALAAFRLDVGRYPTSQQELTALVMEPASKVGTGHTLHPVLRTCLSGSSMCRMEPKSQPFVSSRGSNTPSSTEATPK